MWILSYTHLLFSTHDALHRSFDQYFNIVLEDAVERVMHENVYADKELGVQVIRGDSVSLMGECHSRTIDGNPRLRKAPLEEVEKLREEAAAAAALTPAKPGFSMDDF